MKTQTEQLIEFFFSRSDENACYYFCRNSKCQGSRGRPAKKYKQDPGSGWTNLKNHLRSCVGPNYEDVYHEHLKHAAGNIEGYFFGSPRDTDVFQILEWVVMRNQPLSEVDNKLTRALFKCKPVCSKSLRTYILAMIPIVESTIHSELPDKFGLLFDGWSDSSTHYVALFAVYKKVDSKTKKGINCETLLACRD